MGTKQHLPRCHGEGFALVVTGHTSVLRALLCYRDKVNHGVGLGPLPASGDSGEHQKGGRVAEIGQDKVTSPMDHGLFGPL